MTVACIMYQKSLICLLGVNVTEAISWLQTARQSILQPIDSCFLQVGLKI